MAQVRLLQPGRWHTVWRHALDPDETACSLSTQRIRNGATGALEPFVTVGTALNLGEDYPCTGRVLLFRVTRSSEGDVPADGEDAGWQGELVASRRLSIFTLSPFAGGRKAGNMDGPATAISQEYPCMSTRELRGPVLDIAVLDGLVLAAAGSRLEVLELQQGKPGSVVLQRTAFFDARLAITCLSTIKNFVLLGDVHKGLTFVHCTSANGRQLAELSKVLLLGR